MIFGERSKSKQLEGRAFLTSSVARRIQPSGPSPATALVPPPAQSPETFSRLRFASTFAEASADKSARQATLTETLNPA